MSNDDALKAFEQAAGITAFDLSLFIRTSLLAGFFLWAAWTALELMKYHKKANSENISVLLRNYIQLFILVTLVIALVFIP